MSYQIKSDGFLNLNLDSLSKSLAQMSSNFKIISDSNFEIIKSLSSSLDLIFKQINEPMITFLELMSEQLKKNNELIKKISQIDYTDLYENLQNFDKLINDSTENNQDVSEQKTTFKKLPKYIQLDYFSKWITSFITILSFFSSGGIEININNETNNIQQTQNIIINSDAQQINYDLLLSLFADMQEEIETIKNQIHPTEPLTEATD